MNALFIGLAVYVISSIVCGIVRKMHFPRKHKAAQKQETKPVGIIPAPIVTSCKVDHAKDIKRNCLTEQLLFVEDLLSSESNPEKTLKYMKEKQRILTALADL